MAMTIIGRQESRASLESSGLGAGLVMRRVLCADGDPSRRWSEVYGSGCETKRSIPKLCDKYLATSCPLTLLPASSSGGANVPRPPLPGETVTMPPPIPLLPGQADLVQPVARGFVQAGGRHHGQRVVADGRVDDALLGDRIDAAVGQRGAHHGEVPALNVERTLLRVEVGRLGRVDVDPVEALQQPGDA